MVAKADKPALRALVKAAQDGELDTVRRLVRDHPAVAGHPEPLLKACSFGYVEIVRLLLDAGADPNAPSDGASPGRPLDRTCCVCSQTPWSPGHEATIHLLLERGAALRGRGRVGLTAYGLAAWHNEAAAVKILAGYGADRDLAADEACTSGDVERLRVLLAAAPAAAIQPTSRGYTPLHLVAGTRWYRQGRAVEANLAEIARLLLAHGGATATPPTSGDEPGDPWRWACATGSPAVARVLLEHDHRRSGSFRTLVLCNRVELLELIPHDLWEIDGLADPRSGNRLLAETLRYGQLASTAWLLAHGADPRLTDHQGWTALHYAARRGVNEEVLRALLAAGADPRAVNHDGQTPLDLAPARKRDLLTAILAP